MTHLLLFLSFAFAQEKSAFELALANNGVKIPTFEQWVHIDAKRYRQINYDGTYYYLSMKDASGAATLHCAISSRPVPASLSATLMSEQRTKTFADNLKRHCAMNKNAEVALQLDGTFEFSEADLRVIAGQGSQSQHDKRMPTATALTTTDQLALTPDEKEAARRRATKHFGRGKDFVTAPTR